MDYPRRFQNEPPGRDEFNMAFQIQCLEKQAYGSVLKAFIAQSDQLSWAKEGLMMDLRKELNVTDTEHADLLLKIKSDESLKMIRELQKGAPYVQDTLVGGLNASVSSAKPLGHALRKKRKTSHCSDSHFHKQEPHGQTSRFPVPFHISATSDDKGRGMVKSELKIGCNATPYFDHLKKGPDVIVIRETKKLVHEIERLIYGTNNIAPAQVEKAKLILKDHEKSLSCALAKLSDLSNDDGSSDQMWLHRLHIEGRENKQMMRHGEFHGQSGRSDYYTPNMYPQKKRYPVNCYYDRAHPVRLKVLHP